MKVEMKISVFFLSNDHLILLVVMYSLNYLSYEDMIGYITAFISYICIGFLFYQQDFLSKKSAIKFVVMIIPVQIVLYFAFEVKGNLFVI